MTRQEKVNLLNELLEIEEKNDIGNLTTAERREFQQWVEALDQESKTGHWITHHESMTLLTGETATGGVVCSECGYKTHNKAHILIGCPYKYCPNCGAKMVEPQESENKE